MTMTTSSEATTSWRCWCSTQNTATTSSCTTCTTPCTDMSTQTQAAVSDVDTPVLVEENVPILALVVVQSSSGIIMGAGKIAEQCCAASLSTAWREVQEKNFRLLKEWNAETKTVLCCDDQASMNKLESRASVCGMQTCSTVESGERTVLSIGPATEEQLELVIGDLKPLDWNEIAAVEGQGMDDEALSLQRQEIIGLLSRVMTEDPSAPPDNKKKKIKPNDKCHCGSAKKYKKCCATKEMEVEPTLEELVVDLLGKDAQMGVDGPSSSATEFQGPAKGEKVLGFRKQVEYGAKKYIKP